VHIFYIIAVRSFRQKITKARNFCEKMRKLKSDLYTNNIEKYFQGISFGHQTSESLASDDNVIYHLKASKLK